MATFQLGVIEGFYGRDWDDRNRLQLLPWLQSKSYHSYLFAPKSEHYLRAQWDQCFPESSVQRISGIQQVAGELALRWGLGFSPLGAVNCFDAAAQDRMARKLDSLREFDIDILAILFDDMHVANADLANRQCEIVDFIDQRMPEQQIIMCPSFYSYDPILEKVFGAMPADYWQQLGSGLGRHIDVFWTGNMVCSTSLQCDDVSEINRLLQRPVTLWDNYPVNDGARASQFLHIDSFNNRDHNLDHQVRAHFCNPMNQCQLSRIALASLPMLYQQGSRYDPERAFKQICVEEFGEALGTLLIQHKSKFTEIGLAGFDEQMRQAINASFAQLQHPAAKEVCDWLNGVYTFDPACLTETGS